MPIYKYIKEFLIPPGIYVTIFALGTLYLWLIHTLVKKINQKSISCLNTVRVMLLAGISCCVICCIATYAMSINAGSQRMMHSLEYKYTNKNVTPDAIIVLSATYGRSVTAAKLYKKHKVDVIATGYKGGAEYMAKILRKNGVADEHIILEKQATNTKDHVRYTLPIARAKGYKRVYLVTSAHHMPRSMVNFEKAFAAYGIEVVPYACEYRTPKEYRPSEHDWLPDIRYFNQSAVAWNEYLGMLELWLFN